MRKDKHAGQWTESSAVKWKEQKLLAREATLQAARGYLPGEPSLRASLGAVC